MQDLRYLEKRGGNAWNVTKQVPRHLRRIITRSHLRRSTRTSDLKLAQARRWPILAEMQSMIDAAQKQHAAGGVMADALAWRDTLAKVEAGDPRVWDDRFPAGGAPLRRAVLADLEDEADVIAAQHGEEAATVFMGVATGAATPQALHVESWLREGGSRGPLNERTQRQLRSAVQRFTAWCERVGIPPTIEAIGKVQCARYVTEAFVAEGAEIETTNKHVTSLSSYWRWLIKRTSTTVNPWSGQRRSRAGIHRNGERGKRPFSDPELRALLDGGADQELADVMKIAALSGLCLEEIYALSVFDCRDGLFDVRKGKREARVRKFPIHSELTSIIARRTEGKGPKDFLIEEGGPARADRGKSMSGRFSDYRKRCGVEDKAEGKRQSKIDFHSFRRTFITKARNAGIDYATVQNVCGQRTGHISDDIYSSGPEMAMRRACVEAVRLPG